MRDTITSRSAPRRAYGLLALVLLLAASACATDDSASGSSGRTDTGRPPRSDVGGGGVPDAGTLPDGASFPDGGGTLPDGGSEACGIGRIDGRVCAPSEQAWIGGADVVLTGTDCDGQPFQLDTVSDSDGYFSFGQVPSGFHTLHISKGSFAAEMGVNVRADEVTDLTAGGEKACLDDRDIRIAVVTGTYDSIEDILDNLGVQHDVYSDVSFDVSPAEQFLLDPNALADYDIVMINCGDHWLYFGLLEADPTYTHRQIGLNLRNFVLDGGSLYISDLAYWFIEEAFPEAFEFSDDEADYEAGLRGAISEVVGHVVDPALEAALGQSTINLDFPLQGWAVAQAVGEGASVLIQGDAPLLDGSVIRNAPLLVSYQPTPTSGRIFFTSFHNEAQLASDIQRVLHHVVFSL